MKFGKTSILVALFLVTLSMVACSGVSPVGNDIVDDVEIEDRGADPIFPFIGDDINGEGEDEGKGKGDGSETEKDDDEDKPVCGKHEFLDDNEICVCDEGYELDDRERCLRKYVVGGVKISPNSIGSALIGENRTITFSAEPTNKRALKRERLIYRWKLTGKLPEGLEFIGNGDSTAVLEGTSSSSGEFGFEVEACITIDGSKSDPVCTTKSYALSFKENLVLNAKLLIDKRYICFNDTITMRSTYQSKSFCKTNENEPESEEKWLKAKEKELVMRMDDQLIVVANSKSEAIEWSIRSDESNAKIDWIRDEKGNVDGNLISERRIVSSDGEDLRNVIVTIENGVGDSAKIIFESIKFRDAPPSLVLGNKEERLMARHLLSAPIVYVEDGMQNEQLIECPGRNEVITGIAYKVGILNDAEHAYRCAKYMVGKELRGEFDNLWSSCSLVIKEMTFICKDINELDSKEVRWSNPLSDGLYPGAADAPTQTFEFSEVATSIVFTFGTITTPQVVGVGLAGVSIDPRFEDNLLRDVKNPLIAWSGQHAYDRGIASCDEGEVLTGIRAQTGFWDRSYSIFGASHIQCRKVSVASE